MTCFACGTWPKADLNIRQKFPEAQRLSASVLMAPCMRCSVEQGYAARSTDMHVFLKILHAASQVCSDSMIMNSDLLCMDDKSTKHIEFT